MIIQKRKLDFSITKPCRYEIEAAVFNHYIVSVPSPSTTLEIIPSFEKKKLPALGRKYSKIQPFRSLVHTALRQKIQM